MDFNLKIKFPKRTLERQTLITRSLDDWNLIKTVGEDESLLSFVSYWLKGWLPFALHCLLTINELHEAQQIC